MKQFFYTLWLKIVAKFPTHLPVGVQEFEAWAKKIIALAGPIADEASMKYVLAAQILSIKPNISKVPMNEFVSSLRKAASNQVASAVFADIKTKQQEATVANTQTAAETALTSQGASDAAKT